MKKRLIIVSSCMFLCIFLVGKKWIQGQGTKEAESPKKDDSVAGKVSEVALRIFDEKTRSEILSGLKSFGIDVLKEEVNKRNPYKNRAAEVHSWKAPSWTEQQFINKRLLTAASGQSKFLNAPINPSDALKIGLVFSGGGYRAMILTTGYMQAFSDTGLLDSALYMSTLSGSTWFTAPWILSDKSPTQFKQSLIDKINAKRFDLATLENTFKIDATLLINDVLWPKFIFEQPLSSIELYGALLANALLSDYGDARQRQHLSTLWPKVSNGTKPFPIFTSVSMHKDDVYNWYEFNPLEVRNVEHGIAIDTWAFGRKCDAGKTVDFAPEQSMGTLMGIFGSAYTVNLKDLVRMSEEGAKTLKAKARSQLEKFKAEVVQAILSVLAHEEAIGAMRVWPARMNNPWKNLPDSKGKDIISAVKDPDEIVLVDGGISFNLPLPPLLDRDLDVIIMADSSRGIQEGVVQQKDLGLALEYAKAKGYNYQLYEELRIVFNSTLSVYKDYDNPKAPVIIYFNYQRDLSLFEKVQGIRARELATTYKLKEFDSLKCADDGYCGTFNFNYTPEQLSQLAAIAEFNIRANESQLRTILRKVFESKGRYLGSKDVRPHMVHEYETGGF